MVNSTTTYSFNLPEVNSATDEDLWGGQLNTNWTNLDSILDLRQEDLNFADKQLIRPILKDYAEEIPAAVTISSGAITLDFEDGNHAEVVLTENITTITISNAPASGTVGMLVFYIEQDGTGGRTVTFPSSIKFAGGTAPVITTTASRTDILVFITRDGGTTFAGSVVGQDFAGL